VTIPVRPAREKEPPVKAGRVEARPVATVKAEVDHYTVKQFTEVWKNIKAVVVRPERGFQLEAKRGVREGKPVGTPHAGASPPEAAAAAKVAEALTLFEKIFLARFEGGLPLGEKLDPGQFKFLPKTDEEWAAFFQKFLPFALQKTVNVADLEALIFRGLLKNIMISDLKFLDGKTDKFARLEIHGTEILKRLASMMPGELLARALVAEWMGGPEFAYLALSHKVVNPEAMEKGASPIAEAYQSPGEMKEAAIREGAREATRGIALDARTEQLIVERLDLKSVRGETALDSRSGKVEKGDEGLGGLFFKKRRRGLFGGWEAGGEAGPAFVPWYQLIFRPKKYKGKPRWWVPLIYFVTVSALGLSAFYVFKFLLQR
jgi:hypothetical protein